RIRPDRLMTGLMQRQGAGRPMTGGVDEMKGALRFDTGEVTHPGCVREHNEDAALSLPQSGLWLVSDGVGGHAAGDVASALIVEEVATIGIPISTQDLRARIEERLVRADQRIRDYGHQRGGVLVGATV